MAVIAGKPAQTSSETPAKMSFLRRVASMAAATFGSSQALTDMRSIMRSAPTTSARNPQGSALWTPSAASLWAGQTVPIAHPLATARDDYLVAVARHHRLTLATFDEALASAFAKEPDLVQLAH